MPGKWCLGNINFKESVSSWPQPQLTSIEAVLNVTQRASNTAAYLNESESLTQNAVSLIQKITEASEEQALAATQISEGIEQIASVVQSNSATAEESAATSEELNAQAEVLQSLVARFNLKE